MLVPSRNQRPVCPTFRHWQTPSGSSQMVQTRPAALSGPIGDLRRGGRPEAAAFAAADAGDPGACAPGLGGLLAAVAAAAGAANGVARGAGLGVAAANGPWANLMASGAALVAAAAGRFSASLRAGADDSGVRANVARAASPMTFCATATGATPGGAAAAALVAVPATRTKRRYLSK